MAKNLIRFVTKIGAAPVDIFEDVKFRSAMDMTKRLIGCTISPKVNNDAGETSNTTYSRIDDELWARPDVVADLEQLVEAVSKKGEYVDMDIGPSFKIGLTQMFISTPKNTPPKQGDNPQGNEQKDDNPQDQEHRSEQKGKGNDIDTNLRGNYDDANNTIITPKGTDQSDLRVMEEHEVRMIVIQIAAEAEKIASQYPQNEGGGKDDNKGDIADKIVIQDQQ